MTQRTIRTNHIVLVFPPADYLSCLLEIVEPVQAKTLIQEPPIEDLNETVLQEFSGIDKQKLYLLLIGPCIESVTGKFGAIVRKISFGRPRNSIALFRYLVTCCPVMDVSTSRAIHSLVTSSIRANMRNFLPVAVISLTKSIDQRSLGPGR